MSAAPADTTLSALPPQVATPMLSVTRLAARSQQTPQAPPALVEISNKTITFPATLSGETSGRSVTDQRTVQGSNQCMNVGPESTGPRTRLNMRLSLSFVSPATMAAIRITHDGDQAQSFDLEAR